MPLSLKHAVQRLSRFSLTTADANQLAAFYENAFGCQRLAMEHLSSAGFETLLGVRGGALRITLSLGKQIVELLQFDQPGRPYPANTLASDLIFQHFAIVVSDMARAFGQLSTMKAWTAISCGGPQRLPESSGGVVAFKFRDPDGHPLELLSFPNGAAPVRWQKIQNDAICLGIDHSAISVSSTTPSLSFYESLGFAVSARSINRGEEQEKLDGIIVTEVEVTALSPQTPGPHLELLCYRPVSCCPKPVRSNSDIATTRLVLESLDRTASYSAVDPDGHHVVIEGILDQAWTAARKV